MMAVPATIAVRTPACVMVAVPSKTHHDGPLVSGCELPSEYVAMAVYWAVWPAVTDVGPVMDNPMSVLDVDDVATLTGYGSAVLVTPPAVYSAWMVAVPATTAVKTPACEMVAVLSKTHHDGPLVSDCELPSEYVALPVYWAVWPTVTDVGPVMDNPMSVFDDGGFMVAVVVAAALAPALSVTLRVTVNVPLVEYICIAVADDAAVVLVPSPKSHAYVVIVPVGSCEPLPSTLIGVPAVPL